ncbi:amidase [Pseudaminobacter arsenicus]|uniref:Indoleacetamide hydrolase n=1 Tax=Borborobacter arsenicus TaxID=1851146 RepID=A0A432V4K3_9HYPH|nr:amidase [Pseudaminobacter arsenicus]RUM97077.1 amidase [Pseudaminobacter arsenicus]
MNRTRDRLEQILQRLEARSGEERVFSRLYPEAARAAADAADARRRAGISLGSLDGRIVSIKDLLDVAGETTTAGSAIRRTCPPAVEDAVVVRRLRQAGAVILGKTVMTEFAFTAVGLNPHFGTLGNAADPQRVPGGSSSGAGVSVAEGTCDIAIGSDTGGSIRIPASLNGVVGFKPTASHVSTAGAFPLSFTLDSLGPLARSVAECAAADAVLSGEDGASLGPVSLSGLQIGIPRGLPLADMEPAVAEGFTQSLDILEAAGARLVDHDIDDMLAAMAEATSIGSIAGIEAAAVHADWLGDERKAAMVDPRVAKPLARRATVPAVAYIRMMQRRAELVAEMNRRLAAIDILALPTTPMVAPPIEPLVADRELYNRTEGLLLRNPQIANQFDLAGISLPMPGMSLPAGLMLLCRHGDDRRLLAVAATVEQAFRNVA